MSSRPAVLDISALSPAEFEAYESWLALVSLEGKLTPERMLQLAAQATGPAYKATREEEILAFFEPRPPMMTSGAFLAILRLIAHARTCSVLCRDHVFIQCTPLRLAPASLSSETATVQRSTSNPYRNRVVSEPVTDLGESSNPFRASRTGDTPALSNATSSNMSQTPSTTQAPTIIPPLPPRPSKTASLPPQPPPRTSIIPPPRDSSRVGSTFEVIATSLAAPTPRRPRISPSALLGSTTHSYFEGRPMPPPVLPKPKMVSSTHIGPSTRMRPVTPTAPMLSAIDGGMAPSLSMERSSSGPIVRAPSLSSSSSSDEEIQPVEMAPVPLTRTVAQRPKDRASAPPPPPKRRVSVPAPSQHPIADAFVSRSQSLRQPRAASIAGPHVIVNAGGRPLDSFDLKETASDWYEKARRRSAMPALNGDRKSLLADRGEMGQEEMDDMYDEEDEVVASSQLDSSWARLH